MLIQENSVRGKSNPTIDSKAMLSKRPTDRLKNPENIPKEIAFVKTNSRRVANDIDG